MSVGLTPLGSRVLVRPTPGETQSDGGIVFPETHTPRSAVTGTVLAVGHGPARAHQIRAAVVKRCLAILGEQLAAEDSVASVDGAAERAMRQIAAYGQQVERLAEVQPGDFVTFPFTAGAVMTVDGEDVLVVDEADLTAYWRPEQEQVA